MKTRLIVCWFIVMLSVLYLSGCGASKKHKIKIKEETKIELIQSSKEQSKSTESIVSETKEENKTETIIDKVDSWLNFEADEIIVTSKDETTTKIKNPKINKVILNFNQKSKDETNIVKKDSIVKNEENNTKTDAQLISNETKSSSEVQKEKKQFDFGILVLQLFGAGALIYFCVWSYRKLKKRVV